MHPDVDGVVYERSCVFSTARTPLQLLKTITHVKHTSYAAFQKRTPRPFGSKYVFLPCSNFADDDDGPTLITDALSSLCYTDRYSKVKSQRRFLFALLADAVGRYSPIPLIKQLTQALDTVLASSPSFAKECKVYTSTLMDSHVAWLPKAMPCLELGMGFVFYFHDIRFYKYGQLEGLRRACLGVFEQHGPNLMPYMAKTFITLDNASARVDDKYNDRLREIGRVIMSHGAVECETPTLEQLGQTTTTTTTARCSSTTSIINTFLAYESVRFPRGTLTHDKHDYLWALRYSGLSKAKDIPPPGPGVVHELEQYAVEHRTPPLTTIYTNALASLIPAEKDEALALGLTYCMLGQNKRMDAGCVSLQRNRAFHAIVKAFLNYAKQHKKELLSGAMQYHNKRLLEFLIRGSYPQADARGRGAVLLENGISFLPKHSKWGLLALLLGDDAVRISVEARTAQMAHVYRSTDKPNHNGYHATNPLPKDMKSAAYEMVTDIYEAWLCRVDPERVPLVLPDKVLALCDHEWVDAKHPKDIPKDEWLPWMMSLARRVTTSAVYMEGKKYGYGGDKS